MWKLIVENKEWIFSGAGVALVVGIIGIVFGRKKSGQISTGDHGTLQQSTSTGPGDPTQQMTTAPGSHVIKSGPGSTVYMGPTDEQIEKIVAAAVDRLAPEGGREGGDLVAQQKEQFQRDLSAAIRRAEDAESRALPQTAGLIEHLRKSSDTAGLLDFLLGQRQLVGQFEDRALQERIALNREISAVAFLRGDIDTAESALAEILQALPDDLDALNRTGHIHHTRGNLAEAEQAYRRVLELADSKGDRDGQAVAYGNLGLIYQVRGDLDEAEQMHRKALGVFEQLGSEEGKAKTYGNLGLIYQTRGNLDEAEAMHRKSLEINQQLGRKEGMAADYGNLGLIYQTRGDLDQAEKMFRKALKVDEQLGRKQGQAHQYGNLGLIYFSRGDLDGAEKLFRRALEIHKRLPSKEGMANQHANLGTVYYTRGDLDQARTFWTQARDLYAQIGMPHMVKKLQAWLDGVDSGGEEPSLPSKPQSQ